MIDYLFEEVLSRQPENIQTFLIQTSILERMNGPLCEALLGSQAAGGISLPTSSRGAPQFCRQILEYLDRADLFIVPLDDQREWFRYHHLFADLLRHHLRTTRSAECIAGLYEQASLWCENQGLIDEAMHYTGQYATLSGNQSQLAKLSEMFARQSPDLRQVEVYLQMAEQGAAAKPGAIDGAGYPVAYRIPHTRAILSRFKGDAPETVIENTKKTLDLLPQDGFTYRCSLLQNLGMAYLAMANLEEAWKNLEQCREEAWDSGISYVAIAAAYMMSRCLQTQGRLDAMDQLLKTALADLQRTEATSRRVIPALGLLYIAQAWLLFEQGNGDAAHTADAAHLTAVEQAVRQGLELCALTAEHYVLAKGYALQARLLAAQGDTPAAYTRLEEMAANWPESIGFGAATRIRLMLAQNSEDAGVERFAAQLPAVLEERVFPVSITPQVWHWEEQINLFTESLIQIQPGWDWLVSPMNGLINVFFFIALGIGLRQLRKRNLAST